MLYISESKPKCVATGRQRSDTLWWLTLALTLVVILFTLSSNSALAQLSGKGAIQGSVTDTTGAVIPNATVVATDNATGVKTSLTTTGSGYYAINTLNPGVYTVTLTAKGFQQVVQKNVTVNALESVSLNLQMPIGEATQQITVSSAPPQIETTNAALGATMENDMYSALPIQMSADQRNATAFAYLMPGVQSNETNGNNTDNTGVFNGSGDRGAVAEIYIDGIPFTGAAGTGDPRYVWTAISVDAIDQFQVQTDGYSAQYQGQGLENYTVKSGTNKFHGSLYEFFRNTSLDTWGFFAKVPNKATGQMVKPVEHQNEYGILLGGPIVKNKLFFFGNYDGYRYLTGPNYAYQTNPTAAMLTGDFSDFPQPIYDPTTQVCNGNSCTRQQFMGVKNGVATPNVIPAGQISNASKFFQSFLPPLTNDQTTNNYLGGYSTGLSNWSTTDRIDWTISNRQQLSFIGAAGRQATIGVAAGGPNQAPIPYISKQTYAPQTKIFILEHTYTVNPHVVNQFKYAFGRYAGPDGDPSYSPAYAASAAGISGLPAGQAAGAFPKTTFSGTDAATTWAGTTGYKQATNTYILLDNLQWVHGKHSMTFGIQFQWLQYNFTSPLTGTTPLQATFSDAQTGQFTGGTTTINPKTGASYASFLLGALNSGSFTQNSVIETGARFRPISPYFQDDYRVNDKLTLNLGLRWDIYPSFREVHDRWSFLNPNITNPITGNAGALQFAGSGTTACNCSTPVSTYMKNFGPRIGLAYALNDKTVIRSSFGVMYTHGDGVGGSAVSRQGTGQLGFSATPKPVSTLSQPVFYWDNGFPTYQAPPDIDAGYGTGFSTNTTASAQGINYADPYYGGRTPEFINWTLGFQRQLTPNMALTVSYVGSQGHFESADAGTARGQWSNQLQPKYLALGSLLSANATPANVAQAAAIIPGIALPYASYPTNQSIGQMLKPFPQYNGVGDTFGAVSNSNFNALQLSLNRRMSQGLTFMLNYSYSKAIDDTGTFRQGYNTRLDRALSKVDEPQNLTITSVYNLPFGRGFIGGGNPVTRALTSDWKLSGIYYYHSGSPLAITASGCTNPASSQCMPSLNSSFIGSARQNGSWGHGITASNTAVSYINPNAFVVPAAYTYGDAPRTKPLNLWAPSAYNLDMSIRRTFPIHDTINLSLQADVLNVTNKVQFGGIGTTFAPSTKNGVTTYGSFGQVSSQANNSRDIQLAARINF